jgi:hypothetical protein
MVFSKKTFVADSNEIPVGYRIGWVEFGHRESSGHRPHLLAWEAKNIKKYEFFGFLWISLKRKKRGKIFSTQKKPIEKRNPAVYNSLPYYV